MEPGLSDGDLALVRQRGSYQVGDVVAFRIPDGEAGARAIVIHRIVGGSPHSGYVLKGDNRTGPDIWRPKRDDVVGALSFSVAGGGLVFGFVRSPFALASLAALIAFVVIALGGRKPRRARRSLWRRPIRRSRACRTGCLS